MNKETCHNCGKVMPEEAARFCKMRDMCVESQNRERLSMDDVKIGSLARYARSLCYQCWFSNDQTCYVCELEASHAK